MKTAALIVAAGRGSRAADGRGGPKQYADLAGRSMLSHAVAAFARHDGIDAISVVIHPDDVATYEESVAGLCDKLRDPVFGGTTRQASVLNGLQSLCGQGFGNVLIHDAARPFVSSDVIDGVIDGLASHDGVLAALPVADTLKQCDEEGLVRQTLSREGLYRAQTPQGFDFELILKAHLRAAEEGRFDFTDDAAIAEWAGMNVALSEGARANDKITTFEELKMAQRQLSELTGASETRTGTGFDVHRFTEGNEVILCGVRIAHNHRLDGHSDADVGLHALTDAILGAIGDGDIGQHFPPSDPKWKGASSDKFLANACRRVADLGGRIVNVDVTLLCEEPKIGPHREAMREAVASILQIDVRRVGVKATTTEGLGFTGRREGIAAMASASVRLPVGE